jgi:hypothetical protein
MKTVENPYHVSFSTKPHSRSLVDITVHLSGEPETSCEINQLSIEGLQSILLDHFKGDPHNVDKQISQLRSGDGFMATMWLSEQAIRDSGLLTKAD